jgi:hypothetical protein
MYYSSLSLVLHSHILCSSVTNLAGRKVENKLADAGRRHEVSTNQQLQLLNNIQQTVQVQETAVSRLAEGMYVDERQFSILVIDNRY